jgi:hypothetical protein
VSGKLAEYCKTLLKIAARLHHDMRRTEYGNLEDGTEYAHFSCDHCDAKLTVQRSPKGYRSNSATDNTFQECRK